MKGTFEIIIAWAQVDDWMGIVRDPTGSIYLVEENGNDGMPMSVERASTPKAKKLISFMDGHQTPIYWYWRNEKFKPSKKRREWVDQAIAGSNSPCPEGELRTLEVKDYD